MPSRTVRPVSRPHPILLFSRNFIKHPRMLGSVIPSSRFLVQQVLRPIDWTRARVVVEYGPGVGTITRHVLRRMRPDARLIVLDTNSDFVEFLRGTIQDPRLDVVHGSAADVSRVLAERGLRQADYAISGIPFSTMPAEVRESIVRSTHDALAPGGAFLVYQFSSKVRPDLERVFTDVRPEFEPLNILPAHVFVCSVGSNGNGAGHG
ncbi:MAG TPA: methyltransferase [Longimicrobium sp.]|nr:methyltransferase [Longimicrobium sp.]